MLLNQNIKSASGGHTAQVYLAARQVCDGLYFEVHIYSIFNNKLSLLIHIKNNQFLLQ